MSLPKRIAALLPPLKDAGAAAVTKSTVVVTVDDSGPGMPPDQRARVFEPVVRLETSHSRSTGGSGLGLVIARQIIEGHGGTIAVGDAPGSARVTITLPAA